MFDLNELKTDETAEAEGVWTDKVVPGASFLIARLNNPAFQEAFQEELRPYSDSGVEMPKAEKERVSNELTAKYVLLGWKGVKVGEEELPYSFENACRVLREFPELRGRIIAFAGSFANYKAKSDEAVAKN